MAQTKLPLKSRRHQQRDSFGWLLENGFRAKAPGRYESDRYSVEEHRERDLPWALLEKSSGEEWDFPALAALVEHLSLFKITGRLTRPSDEG